jgi:hypothetical protein
VWPLRDEAAAGAADGGDMEAEPVCDLLIGVTLIGMEEDLGAIGLLGSRRLLAKLLVLD